MNRDLKASDFSSISWMVLLVEGFVDDATPLEEPEGPGTTGKQGREKWIYKEHEANWTPKPFCIQIWVKNKAFVCIHFTYWMMSQEVFFPPKSKFTGVWNHYIGDVQSHIQIYVNQNVHWYLTGCFHHFLVIASLLYLLVVKKFESREKESEFNGTLNFWVTLNEMRNNIVMIRLSSAIFWIFWKTPFLSII